MSHRTLALPLSPTMTNGCHLSVRLTGAIDFKQQSTQRTHTLLAIYTIENLPHSTANSPPSCGVTNWEDIVFENRQSKSQHKPMACTIVPFDWAWMESLGIMQTRLPFVHFGGSNRTGTLISKAMPVGNAALKVLRKAHSESLCDRYEIVLAYFRAFLKLPTR